MTHSGSVPVRDVTHKYRSLSKLTIFSLFLYHRVHSNQSVLILKMFYFICAFCSFKLMFTFGFLDHNAISSFN